MASRLAEGWILGLDIGGTKTAVVAGTRAGEVLESRVHAMSATATFEQSWDAIRRLADDIILERGRPGIIGVSIGGPLDTHNGVVLSPPNLPGWDAIPLRTMCEAHFGVRTHVEHDARTGALAEWMFGAARGARHVAFLTFGTGLGCGLIIDGRLHRGAADSAGEVGHWRMAQRGPTAFGKAGSWEAFASGAGLPRLARHLYPRRAWPADLNAEMLIGLARDGDAVAGRVVEAAAVWLGRGIAYLVDLLDPEIVVLGSLAVRAGDLFLPTASRTVRLETLPRTHGCRIVVAGLGEHLGDVAALSAAIYHESAKR
jgi:glucokinase